MDHTAQSDQMPDEYARQMGLAQGTLTQKTPAIVRQINPLGVGGTRMYAVQTFRRIDRDERGRITRSHDTIFIEIVGTRTDRFVLPPAVADAIARQRDKLGEKVRRASAKATAAKRQAAGLTPAFLKKRAK